MLFRSVLRFLNGLSISLPIVVFRHFRLVEFHCFGYCLIDSFIKCSCFNTSNNFCCFSLVLQGSPIDWVSTHRYHHQFVDSERDPHSPTAGFWFSHMSWLFDTTSMNERV